MIQNDEKTITVKKKITQCLSGERLRKDHVSCSEELARSPSLQLLTFNNDIINA